MNFKKLIYASLVLSLTVSSLTSMAQDVSYKFLKKVPLDGDGKWDYLKIDRQGERLFISHFDRVQVLDLKTNSLIGTINSLKGAHGIALAPSEGFGYISNGLDNTVTVFDYKTLKTLKIIPVSGKKPDAIIYEPLSKKIIVFCKKSDNAIVIDITKNEETNTIDLDGAPEFAVADGKGLVYNNLEDKNEVITIDISRGKVITRFPLGANAAPTGIAADKTNQRLFVACSGNQTLSILSASDGHLVASLPIGKGTDAVVFDEDRKVIAASNADGTATIIKQLDSNHYNVVQNLKTNPGCKTLAYRATTHYLYLTSAEKDGQNIKPGTFGVYVYGPAQ